MIEGHFGGEMRQGAQISRDDAQALLSLRLVSVGRQLLARL